LILKGLSYKIKLGTPITWTKQNTVAPYLTRLFELFFLPPGIFIVLLLLGVLLIKNLRQLKRLILLQVVLIYVLSIPITTHFLFIILETVPVLTLEQINDNQADVIVVLAGGIKPNEKEYYGPDVGYFTQLRLRYAAWLQKQTHLPVLVTGGIEKEGVTEAELMKQVLEEEYEVSDKILVEKNSQNTYENSLFSSKIMTKYQLKSYYLVTNAFHMPRAMMAFKKHNPNIIPAPMGFNHNRLSLEPVNFLANSKSLWQNYLALHEIIGLYWYKIRY